MTFFATSFTATQPIADGNVDIDAMTMARLHLEFNDRGVAVLGPPTLTPAAHQALLNEALAQRRNTS